MPDIVIVDSFSTDNTAQIAKSYPNVNFLTSPWIGFVENKKIALANTKNDWVLWVDADEEVSSELEKEIKQLFLHPLELVVFDIPRKTYFLNKWIKHTGWYPGRVKRLFNKQHCHFNNHLLHEGIETTLPHLTGHLKNDLHHYSYKTLYQYFDKMNYYGKSGAEELKRKGRKYHHYQLVLNPISTFLKFYLLKKGFKDGVQGFIISAGSAFSNFIKYVNFYYLTKNEKDHN